MDTKQIIGKNIKEYRESFGYSQDHIGATLGVDRSIISRYESGERDVTLVHLHALSDIFGIEIEDLLEPHSVHKEANLAFAFRSDGLEEGDVKSIAEFQKVVKNYLKIDQIAHGNC